MRPSRGAPFPPSWRILPSGARATSQGIGQAPCASQEASRVGRVDQNRFPRPILGRFARPGAPRAAGTSRGRVRGLPSAPFPGTGSARQVAIPDPHPRIPHLQAQRGAVVHPSDLDLDVPPECELHCIAQGVQQHLSHTRLIEDSRRAPSQSSMNPSSNPSRLRRDERPPGPPLGIRSAPEGQIRSKALRIQAPEIQDAIQQVQVKPQRRLARCNSSRALRLGSSPCSAAELYQKSASSRFGSVPMPLEYI